MENREASRINRIKSRKLGKLGLLSTALNTGIGVSSFVGHQNEGDDVVSSAVKATAETAFASLIGPGKYLTAIGLTKVPGIVSKGYSSVSQAAKELERSGSAAPFSGNTFVDNTQIFTMRQAAMATIQQAKYNTEHAMQGNEARYFHK